jgi:hypothetical protein
VLERVNDRGPSTFQQTKLLGDVSDADGHPGAISRQEHMLVRIRRVAIDDEHGPVGYADDALGRGASETVAEAPTIRSEHDKIGIPLDGDIRDDLMWATCANRDLGTIARSRELARTRIEDRPGSRPVTVGVDAGLRRVDDVQQKKLRTQGPRDGISTRHRTIRALQ